MPKALLIEAARTAYSPAQIARTLTIGELIELLSEYDAETEIYISNDNGYTFGAVTYDTVSEYWPEDDE